MGRIDRLLLAIAGALLPIHDREWMLGDIAEDHAAISRELGPGRARRWLAAEILRIVASTMTRRLNRPAGPPIMRNAWQDVRYAARLLLRSPGHSLAAALTLALGIGANTAIFSVVHGVLLKPLPYPEADRLVRVFESYLPDTPEFPMSPGTFVEMRDRSQPFAALAAYERSDLQLGGEQPEQLRGMRVSAGFFELLGHRPMIGREFTRDDEAPGRARVAVLSHDLWVRRFGGDPSIVGETVRLSGRPFQIVGVLPAGVQHVGGSYRSYPHGESVDIWWPRTLPSTPAPSDRAQHYLSIVGRLRPGVTLEQAGDDVRQTSARLAKTYPKTNEGWSSHLRPLRSEIIGSSRTTLVLLLAATAAVLLTACLNVAGLLLGRATSRVREVGVRTALGATRARLVRQLVIESSLLALLGGIGGVALAYAAVATLVAIAPADTPRLHMISVDGAVLAYTFVATAATTLLFGLAPAVQLARADAAPTLQGDRGSPARRQSRLRRGLVVAEIAMAFVLVASSGLLLRSFGALLATDSGFRSDRVLTAVLTLPSARYVDAAAATAFFDRVRARVGALPGVRSVGLTSDLPWTGYDENTGFGIAGRTFARGHYPEARYHFITPGWLTALGLPLRAGRDVTDGDAATAPLVVLINETTARQHWGDPALAIGARLELWGGTRTVVGVVGDLRDTPGSESTPGGIYFPQAQHWYPQDMVLTIRTDSDPLMLAAPLEKAIHGLDPELPLASVRTLDEIAGLAFGARRFTLALVVAFGTTALLLALIGVYGVTSQAVGQRVREFGIRLAVGASPSDIFRLVLASGSAMGVAGVAVGVMAAVPLMQLLRSLLYRTSPLDPLTLTAVGLLLLLATLAAAYGPARRATRTEPSIALRQ